MAIKVSIGGNGTLFIGEDKTFRFEILQQRDDGLPHDATSVPEDVSGMSLLMDVRSTTTSPDPAILSKTATITGVYNAVRASNTQRAVVVVTDTEMNLFRARSYQYSVKRMDDGSETVYAYGDFVPEKATAP